MSIEAGSGIEPLISKIPTSELRRILTENFSRDVSDATVRRILRPLAYFGLPGIVLIGTIVWGVLESSMQAKVIASTTASTRELREAVTNAVQPILQSRADAIKSEVLREAQTYVIRSFSEQQGQALRDALEKATTGPEFGAQLRKLIEGGLRDAWATQSQDLQSKFIGQIVNNQEFRNEFAGEVGVTLGKSDVIRSIISKSLENSAGRPQSDGSHQATALGLLAAIDQAAANRMVQQLLDMPTSGGQHNMALQALGSVNVASIDRLEDVIKVLQSALSVWSEYCNSRRCSRTSSEALAMSDFLMRGGNLKDDSRRLWVNSLKVWHERMMADHESPVREVSIDLVPRSLASMGTEESIALLINWSISEDTELALSTTSSVAGLSRQALPDDRRIELFRALWKRVVDAGGRQALEEAALIGLGNVSRGRADSAAGPFVAEARLWNSQGTAGTRSELTNWAAVRRGGPRPILKKDGCAMEAGAERSGDVVDAPTRLATNLCALAALVRPNRGAAEWNALRPNLMYRDQVALLGVLWAIASDKIADYAGPSGEARFAPLVDLLKVQRPSPAEFELAAMLILRTAPDKIGWVALENLDGFAENPWATLSVTRWLFRSGTEERRWFVDRMRNTEERIRNEILTAIVGFVASEQPRNISTTFEQSITRTASSFRSFPTALKFNALHTIYEFEPELVLLAMEKGNALLTLKAIAGGTRVTPGIRADEARMFDANLAARAGWPDIISGTPTMLTPNAATRLVASSGGRFGTVRIGENISLKIESESNDEKTPSAGRYIVLRNVKDQNTYVLRGGETWMPPTLMGSGSQDWIFRLHGSTPSLALRAIEMPFLTLAPGRDSVDAPSKIPTAQIDRRYRIAELGQSQRIGYGWVRLEGVEQGKKVIIETTRLGNGVDTGLALVRGREILSEDDDGGEGFASKLEWIADRSGSILIRLTNTGTVGGFDLVIMTEK